MEDHRVLHAQSGGSGSNEVDTQTLHVASEAMLSERRLSTSSGLNIKPMTEASSRREQWRLSTSHESEFELQTFQVAGSTSMHDAAVSDEDRIITSPEEGIVQQEALPPADGGKQAYLVLAAAFILEGLVWGFPFAFGVFQEAYTTDPLFSQDESSIVAIGTTATGIMYLSAPLCYTVLRRFPAWRKPVSIFGFVILTAGLIAASFANTTPQLLATQGVMYAVGGSLHYFPVFQYLDEWWVARKGFAYGVVWAGGGATGVAAPLVLRWIITTYGFRTALRTWAIISFVLTVPALFGLKGRLPIHHANRGRQKVDFGFLKSSAFWILQIGNMAQGLGYFMPSLYLPSFARTVGLSALLGTIAVSLMNAANIAGATIAGIMADKFHVTTAINFCAIGTATSVFLFWSFAVYTPVLFLFAILYGVFAGGFASTWACVADPIRRKYPATDTGMIVSCFAMGKGIASIVSGPISGVLVRSDVWRSDGASYAFGSGYGYLIVFSGVTAAMSLVGWFGKKCGLV